MSLSLSPTGHRQLNFGYWLLWLGSVGTAALSLRFESCGATLPLLALALMPISTICWLFLPPPYPGAIALRVTATAAAPQTVSLPRAFSSWSRIDLIRTVPEAAPVSGGSPVAEVISQPGNERAMLELRVVGQGTGANAMATMEFARPAASATVRIVAPGEWLVRAGEDSHTWKDARLGWTVSRKARPLLSWGGALICLGLLVRCSILIRFG